MDIKEAVFAVIFTSSTLCVYRMLVSIICSTAAFKTSAIGSSVFVDISFMPSLYERQPYKGRTSLE